MFHSDRGSQYSRHLLRNQLKIHDFNPCQEKSTATTTSPTKVFSQRFSEKP